MADREVVLDALMDGASIETCARRFGMHQSDVRTILREETDRCYDGAEMRAEWTLTARRLKRMEVMFDRKAIEELDCAAAVVAIKASERRATLTGANAVPAHLVTVMHQAKIAEDDGITNTQRALAAIRRLKDEHTAEATDEPPRDG